MKLLTASLAITLAACSAPYDVEAHFRHHENTARFEALQRQGAEAEAERTCGGAVELTKGKEGLEPADYRCKAQPERSHSDDGLRRS